MFMTHPKTITRLWGIVYKYSYGICRHLNIITARDTTRIKVNVIITSLNHILLVQLPSLNIPIITDHVLRFTFRIDSKSNFLGNIVN